MTNRQIADDPGWQQRDVYLGGKNARWPWDWTYQEWGVAFMAFLVGGILITWAVPAGLVVGLLAYRFASTAARQVRPDSPTLYRRVVFGGLVFSSLLVSPHVGTWLNPVPLLVALVMSFILPFRAVKIAGPYLNWNRPLAYWFRLPRLVASGPREPQPETFDTSRMAALASGLDDRETGEIVPGEVHAPLVIKAKITSAPVKITSPAKAGGKARVTKRPPSLPAPGAKPRNRKPRYIERTTHGVRVGATEYRIEWGA